MRAFISRTQNGIESLAIENIPGPGPLSAGQVRVAIPAAFATVLMFVSFLPTIRFYRQSALWSLTLPAAAVFYGYATALSGVRYWRGQGGQWKGRAQAPKETS